MAPAWRQGRFSFFLRRRRRIWSRKDIPEPRPRLRLAVIGFVVTCFFGSLLVRLYSLQILEPQAAQPVLATTAIRVVYDPAPRGLILAREGQVLANNKTVFEVTMERQVGTKDPAVVRRIAAILHQGVSQVHNELNNVQISPYQPVPLAVGVPISTVARVKEDQSELPGVGVQLVPERYYPQGSFAAQLIGYLGHLSPSQLHDPEYKSDQPTDWVGESGIEASYEPWLHGKDGTTALYVNAQGDVVGVARQTPPTPGDTVVLNLDYGLQKAAQEFLAQDIHSLEGTYDPTNGARIPSHLGGAVVVLDPNNGAVLAMASYPTYNANVWDGGISQANYAKLTNPQSDYPLLNRAIQGLYPPGSTFKLVTATAALKDGLITPTSTIDDATGTFTIPNCTRGPCTFHNDTLALHPGPINVTWAISASDDVFFYTLGVRFYEQDFAEGKPYATPIQDMANAYGLGVPTGVDLPNEFSGQIDSYYLRVWEHEHYPKAFPNPPSWYAGDNLELAFGQGETLITPLQLAVAYATFANGGTRYVPEVAAAILSPSGKLIRRIKPKVAGHVTLPPADRAAMLAGFEGAVDQPYGTAYYTFLGFPLNKMQVAGKTGTGSVNGPNGLPEEPDSWFVGFGPAQHPKYVVVAVIQNGGYGAAASAVVVRDIFSYLLSHPVPPLKLPKQP
jgi:penicillin-binding protein 2